MVFYHAHPIASLVKLVKFSQLRAGHIGALMAEAELAADFAGAVAFDESAVFVSNAAAATMGHHTFLSWNATAVGKVAFADTAVHAAGGDEFRSKVMSHMGKWLFCA